MSPVILLSIDEPPKPAQPDRAFAVWSLGFRPFYLLASGFAALSIGAWGLQFTGALPGAVLHGPLWHAHEMLFGFALAVIVGFLFTAGRNWTNQPTPTGRTLAALAALWLAGRVLALTPFALAAAAASVTFPLAAAAALAHPFVAARNRRNYFFVGLLVLMAVADALFHLALAGRLALPVGLALQAGLDVVLFIMAVMGGRVIPMFTNNAIPGAAAARQPLLEKTVLATTLALLPLDLLRAARAPWPPAWMDALMAAVLIAAALLHALRIRRWHPWTTRRVPIVWVLHLAYAWIAIHLALRAAAVLGAVPASAATHALTVGAIGGLVIGMMTRTALGHTGRPLRAGTGEVVSYVLVALAAALRTFVPLAAPALTVAAVGLSAALWSAACAMYFVGYWPVLTRARVDGRPG